jgi:hypothetical protein
MPTREEYHHNTPEQIEDYLASAAEVVGRIELPDDLRGIAFNKAVDLFAAKQIILAQPAAVPGLIGPPH